MKNILFLTAGILLMSATLYAGNGDLIVNGNVGVGATTTPSNKLSITTTSSSSSGLSLNGKAALTASSSDTWLRLNNDNSFSSGVYTLGNITADGGFSTSWQVPPPSDGAYFGGKVGIGGVLNPSYTLTVGGSALAAGGSWVPSDSKFKKDIKQIDSALDKVNKLTGVSYLYKTDEYKDKGFPEGTQLGVIAQDIEKVIPEAVMTDEEGTKAVNYSMIIPVLIEAIKAQQAEIDELKGKTSNK